MMQRVRGARPALVAIGAVAVMLLALLALRAARGIPTTGAYVATIAVTALVFAVFAVSLNLQFGFAGLINFGHVAFMALGAYTMAITTLRFGWPLAAAVPAGMAVAVLFALLLALPTLRLREDYLSIVTIGAAEVLRLVLLNEEEYTGGASGPTGFPRPFEAFFEGDLFARVAEPLGVAPPTLGVGVMAVLVLAAVLALLRVLTGSPWGRVLRAIRDDEDAAAAVGKNVFVAKLVVLSIGAAIAALAGMLYAWSISYFDPVHFLPIVTFYAWIILVLGGVGSMVGAVAGAFMLFLLFELARSSPAADAWGLQTGGPGQIVLIGVLLVAFMLYRPQGLLGKKEEMRYGK